MKVSTIDDTGIEFNTGIRLEDYHENDCCESVYADFNYLTLANVNPATGQKATIFDVEFDENIQDHVKLIEEMGFNLIAKDGSQWFVPCHNVQNGYYSSDLALEIKKDGQTLFTVDISKCVKDDID